MFRFALDVIVAYVALEVSVAAILLDEFSQLFGLRRLAVRLFIALALTLWLYVIIEIIRGLQWNFHILS